MFEQRIPRDIAIVIITGFTGRSVDGQEGSTGRKETGDRNAWGCMRQRIFLIVGFALWTVRGLHFCERICVCFSFYGWICNLGTG